jgi:hypothetical protein
MCGRFFRKGNPRMLSSSLGGEISEENWIDEMGLSDILCLRSDFCCFFGLVS